MKEQNRRSFMKKLMIGSAVVGFGKSTAVAGKIDSKYNKTDEYSWLNTIFCQFEDQELKERIEKCASEINCKVYFGEPNSPDMIAIPYFISIVDRNVVGIDEWENYLNYCDETSESTPCIILDKEGGDWFEWPNSSDILVNMEYKEILDLIKETKNEVDSTPLPRLRTRDLNREL